MNQLAVGRRDRVTAAYRVESSFPASVLCICTYVAMHLCTGSDSCKI